MSDAGMNTTVENVACPKCGRAWPPDCEQAICIEMYDECIVCRFVDNADWSQAADLDAIQAERQRRLAAAPQPQEGEG